jgi:conjugal transfer pilus assembly protein TraE
MPMLDFLTPQDDAAAETRRLATRPASFAIHRYLQGSSNLFEENRLLKFAIVGLFGVSAVLGLLLYTSNQNSRTVLVPFGASGDLYVTGTRPSDAYLRSITRNIVALAGTYSAYSAGTQFQELLGIVHPSAFNAMRDSLNAILDDLDQNPTLSIATYIRADQPVVHSDHDILVPVEKVRVIGGVIRKFRGTLRLAYRIEYGRFWLTGLSEENFDAGQ